MPSAWGSACPACPLMSFRGKTGRSSPFLLPGIRASAFMSKAPCCALRAFPCFGNRPFRLGFRTVRVTYCSRKSEVRAFPFSVQGKVFFCRGGKETDTCRFTSCRLAAALGYGFWKKYPSADPSSAVLLSASFVDEKGCPRPFPGKTAAGNVRFPSAGRSVFGEWQNALSKMVVSVGGRMCSLCLPRRVPGRRE